MPALNYQKIYPKPIDTCFVDAKDVPGLRPGDHFANSVRDGVSVVADGGLDPLTVNPTFVRGKQARRYQERGKFIICYRGKHYRYVVRPCGEGKEA